MLIPDKLTGWFGGRAVKQWSVVVKRGPIDDEGSKLDEMV